MAILTSKQASLEHQMMVCNNLCHQCIVLLVQSQTLSHVYQILPEHCEWPSHDEQHSSQPVGYTAIMVSTQAEHTTPFNQQCQVSLHVVVMCQLTCNSATYIYIYVGMVKSR